MNPDPPHNAHSLMGEVGAEVMIRSARAGNSRRWVGWVLPLLTLWVFWPLVRAAFINYDDPLYFSANPHVLPGLTLDGVRWAFQSGEAGFWQPLTWLSLMLDATIFGRGPFGPHLTNLLLHALNVALVFSVFQRLTGACWRSAAVAAMFALHPLQVESVAWVSERKEILSSMFGLLALGFYTAYAQVEQASYGLRMASTANDKVAPLPATIRHSSRNYWLAFLFFVCGLMSKTMVVSLPGVMLLLDYWPLNRMTDSRWQTAVGRLVREKLPFIMASVVFGVTTLVSQRRIGAVPSTAVLSLSDRAANALVSYARYLGKAFWPVDLALPYLRPPHWNFTPVLGASMLVITFSLVALALGRKRPYVAVGWLWFLGTLVPVIGLIQVGQHAMADRFMYWPLIGLGIIVSWGLAEVGARLAVKKILLGAFASAGLLVCAGKTRKQIGYWQDSGTLFRHTLAVTKDNFVANNNLGTYLFDGGNFDEAAAQYRAALKISNRFADAWNNLGLVLVAQKNPDEAVKCYEAALQIEPENPGAHSNLGNLLAEQGKPDEAIPHFRAALHAAPDDARANSNLAIALAAQGKAGEALNYFEAALRAEPFNPQTHYNLGNVLAMDEKYSAAADQFAAALQLAPGKPDIQFNLGLALERLGRLKEAHEQFNAVLESGSDTPELHFHLGRVLAGLGWRAEAVAHLQKALQMRPGYEEVKQELTTLGAATAE